MGGARGLLTAEQSKALWLKAPLADGPMEIPPYWRTAAEAGAIAQKLYLESCALPNAYWQCLQEGLTMSEPEIGICSNGNAILTEVTVPDEFTFSHNYSRERD